MRTELISNILGEQYASNLNCDYFFQSWLYNRNCNTGKIANIVQNKQRGQKEKRLRGGGTDRRKRSDSAGKEKAVVPLLDQVPDSDLSKDVCLNFFFW